MPNLKSKFIKWVKLCQLNPPSIPPLQFKLSHSLISLNQTLSVSHMIYYYILLTHTPTCPLSFSDPNKLSLCHTNILFHIYHILPLSLSHPRKRTLFISTSYIRSLSLSLSLFSLSLFLTLSSTPSLSHADRRPVESVRHVGTLHQRQPCVVVRPFAVQLRPFRINRDL